MTSLAELNQNTKNEIKKLYKAICLLINIIQNIFASNGLLWMKKKETII